MISRSKRLTTQLFKEIIQKGTAFHGQFFIVRCLNTQGLSRFGVSVPKKVSKTAVERNKARRRVYSIIKKYQERLVSGKNAVFIMKVGSEKISFAELSNEIEKIFVKSGLLK
jgi:ribonuclease P protein component